MNSLVPDIDPCRRFTGLPVLTAYIDGDTWRLVRDVTYRVCEGPHAGKTLTMRSGFVFDWASTPSLLWFCLPKAGKKGNPYGIAALIHDWLYRHRAIAGQPITRAEADEVFLEVLRYLGVHNWFARMMWSGVRVGGWLFWKSGAAAGTEQTLQDASGGGLLQNVGHGAEKGGLRFCNAVLWFCNTYGWRLGFRLDRLTEEMRVQRV
jgi:hypothetical protein